MSNYNHQRISQYKFQDAVQIVKTVVTGNLFLWLYFVLLDWTHIYSDLRTQFCLVSGVIVLFAIFFYDWKSFQINILLIAIYLSIVVIELLILGIPKNQVRLNDNISKGFMLDLMIGMLPSLYVFFRILLVGPLVLVLIRAKRLIEEASKY